MHAKWRKIVIGILFLIIFAGSSATIAFADHNISGLLTEWFDRKTEESVEEIEEVILKEQQKQTEKLEAELHMAIETAEQEMQIFLEAEKEYRVEEIRQYASFLMEEIEIDDAERKEAKLQELERILNEAKAEMDQMLADEKLPKEEIQAEELERETDD